MIGRAEMMMWSWCCNRTLNMTAGINTAFDRLASCPMFEEGRDCVLLLLRACGDGFCQKRCLVHMSLHNFTSASPLSLSKTGKRAVTNFVCQLHESCLHKLRFAKKTKSSPGLSVSLLHTPISTPKSHPTASSIHA
jgi:hypothetical protein